MAVFRIEKTRTCKNITYKSASGNSYDFNTADKMNCLLIKALLATGQLKSGQEYGTPAFCIDHIFCKNIINAHILLIEPHIKP